MISSPCEKCNEVEYEMEEKDIVDVLEDLASQTDARVEVISPESEEKAKLKALGGFAASLEIPFIIIRGKLRTPLHVE